MLQDLGREPMPEEIGAEMDMPTEKVREIQKLLKNQYLWKLLLVKKMILIWEISLKIKMQQVQLNMQLMNC